MVQLAKLKRNLPELCPGGHDGANTDQQDTNSTVVRSHGEVAREHAATACPQPLLKQCIAIEEMLW
jgi:hypothetical protein